VLTKVFGPHNLQLSEDVVQDTMIKALDTWKVNGIPGKPAAWLFSVARNKAIDIIRRQKKHNEYAHDISIYLQSEYTLAPTINELVNTHTLEDDRLRMMFVCCHPCLSSEASITLILKTLCGFSINEIAKAFLASYDTIEKRLYRARQSFRDNNVQFEMPPATEIAARLQQVFTAIYLLFNEGYASTDDKAFMRTDMMDEAIRLCELICNSHLAEQHNAEANALMALMCFTAARNKARTDEEGNILLLDQQDRKKWSRPLIKKAIAYLELASTGTNITRYHLEAGIAYEHAKAADYTHTNWQQILSCYNILYRLQPSPVVALNRAIVISQLHGAAEGIKAIESIEGIAYLNKYYLLPATLGELYYRLKEYNKASIYFNHAIQLTQSNTEKKLLQQKLLLIPK
jgi:RNA polymerase sigma-70 factor (ECF subfamily)